MSHKNDVTIRPLFTKSSCKLLFFFLVIFIVSFASAVSAFALPIIPGAAGYGIDTPAGRGGTVYKVTSLDDDKDNPQPGTLRYAINQSGPRVIIFEVSGTINVGSEQLRIRNPYITIAGQTAPSPGIFLRGGVIWVETHDVLIQHLRVAPGDDNLSGGIDVDIRDGISVGKNGGDVDNVVIDHCTFTWSVDELFGTYWPSGKVTFRNILGAEPLNEAIPNEPHALGSLFSNHTGSKVTFTGSLLSHCTTRMPLLECPESIMVNNMIYDRGFYGTQLRNQFGLPSKVSLEGNVYVDGPTIMNYQWALNRAPLVLSNDPTDGHHDIQPESEFYLQDNAWTDYYDVTRNIT